MPPSSCSSPTTPHSASLLELCQTSTAKSLSKSFRPPAVGRLVVTSPTTGEAASTRFSAAVADVFAPPLRWAGDANTSFEFSYTIPAAGVNGVVVRGWSPIPTATFVLPPGDPVVLRAQARSADGTLSPSYATAQLTVSAPSPARRAALISSSLTSATLAIEQGDTEQGLVQATALAWLVPRSDTGEAQDLRAMLVSIVGDSVSLLSPTPSAIEAVSEALLQILDTVELSQASRVAALQILKVLSGYGDAVTTTAGEAVLGCLSALATLTLPTAVAGSSSNGPLTQYSPPGYAPPPAPMRPPLPPRIAPPPRPSPPRPPAPLVRSRARERIT